MTRTRGMLVVLLATIALGCDKAKPFYETCTALEGTGKLDEAKSACENGSQVDPESKFGKMAADKAAAIQAKLDEIVPDTVTTAWCTRLGPRLNARLTLSARAKSPGQDVSGPVRDQVQEVQYECGEAAGQSTAGKWACWWNATFDNYKTCGASNQGAPEEAAASASAAPPPSPLPGQPGGDVLREHPGVLAQADSLWLSRTQTLLTGGKNAGDRCPGIERRTFKDDSEKASALAACDAQSQRALDYLKTCPAEAVFALDSPLASDFDAARGRLRLRFHSLGIQRNSDGTVSGAVLVSQQGRVLIGDKAYNGVLLDWPGAYTFMQSGKPPCAARGNCCELAASTPSAGMMSELDAFQIDAQIDQEGAMKVFAATKDTLSVELHVAYVLDGKLNGTDTFACNQDKLISDQYSFSKVLTGRALAWRVAVAGDPRPKTLLDWQSVSNLELGAACDGAKQLFARK